MHRSVVSKIRAYNPNRPGTALANLEYCKYIATRPGVAITEVDLAQKHIKDMSDNESYVSYIAKRPRSHGLFGNIETENLTDVGKHLQNISQKKQVIYRGILSLSEKDAQELGYYDRSKWELLLKATMSDIGKEFSIPIDRLEWVAAFHQEPTHPHVHYMFWDKKERIVSPYIHVSKQHQCREIFSREIYREERERTAAEKTIQRDMILEYGKEVMSLNKLALNNIFSPDQIYPVFSGKTEHLHAITKEMFKLIEMLPSSGRLSYAFMPPEVKEQVNTITELIITQKEIAKETAKFIKNSARLARLSSAHTGKKEHTENNSYKDLQKRVGNIVLKSAAEFLPKQERISNILNRDPFADFIDALPKPIDSFSDIGSTPEPTASFLDTEVSSEPAAPLLDIETFSDSIPQGTNIEADFQPLQKPFFHTTELLSPSAYYDTAVHLEKGIGVDRDLSEAQEHYARALELFENEFEKEPDSSFLAYRIGSMHLKGQGTERSPKAALTYLMKSVKLGNLGAMYSVAGIYIKNPELAPTPQAAFKLLQDAASQSHPQSCYQAAIYLEKGAGVEKNLPAAQDYYTKALKLFKDSFEQQPKSAFLAYRIGSMHLNGQGTDANPKEALKYLTKAIGLGSLDAMCSVAGIYIDNSELAPDPQAAFKLLQDAASQGHPQSCFQAAICLEKGAGVEKNLPAAQDYYTKALKLFKDNFEQQPKSAFLAYRIGSMYLNGQGVESSPGIALEYFHKALKLGSLDAMYSIAKIYIEHPSLAPYKDAAFQLLQNAANQGHSYSCYQAAVCLENGLHVIKSPSTAQIYYKKALQLLKQDFEQKPESGFLAYRIGSMYLKGQGIEANYDIGLKYLLKAAESKNDTFFKIQLAKFYLSKEYGHYDFKKGFSQLLSLAENNDASAQYELGCLYAFSTNKDIPRNHKKAEYWLLLSNKNGNTNADNALNALYSAQKMMLYQAYRICFSVFDSLSKDNTALNEGTNQNYQKLSKQAKQEYLRQQGLDVSEK